MLGKQLQSLDEKISLVKKITKLTKEQGYKVDDSLVFSALKMNVKLTELKAKGKIPRPDRQVGAWQSFETSPHSKLRDVIRISRAQTTIPSLQNKQMLKEATRSIAVYSKEVETFITEYWLSFEAFVNKSKLIDN